MLALPREMGQLWKAYQFLHSTYDAQGLPQNFGIGHGWVEGGPLLPVKGEIYQSGVACGRAAGAREPGAPRWQGRDQSSSCRRKLHHLEPASEPSLLDRLRRSATRSRWIRRASRWMSPAVLATVPMWFGLLREDQAEPMIRQLSAPEHETDWGMRIIYRASRPSTVAAAITTGRCGRYSRDGRRWGSTVPSGTAGLF